MNPNTVSRFQMNSPASPVLAPLSASWRLGKTLCALGTGAESKPRDWHRDPSENFTDHEKETLKQCIFYAGKAREKAQEDIPSSCQLFGVARLVGTDPTLTREASLLCLRELEASEAYLDYVCDALDAAKQRLLAAMKADETLEREYGHPDLHIHRIHLANNIIKIEAHSQRLSEALTLAACIVHYIDNEVHTLPLPGEWGGAYQTAIPDAARHFLCRQTTLEVACATADPNVVSDFNMWNAFYDTLGPAGPSSARCADISEWYVVKHAFLQSCRELSSDAFGRYCAAAADFLRQGPHDNISLWKFVALDAAIACSNFDEGPALQLRADILADLSHATFLPRHVRALVARLRATTGTQPEMEQLPVRLELVTTSAS